MPIDHRIDHERRIVFATMRGVLETEDMFAYQRQVWTLPEVAGYDELVDMRGVERVAYESQDKVRGLVTLAAQADRPGYPPMKMAIVATADGSFGLGRMYESLRALAPGSNKVVRTFRDHDEALAWLTSKEPE